MISTKDGVEKKNKPQWISPMLATLTHDYFSDKNWIFERKLDGERCIIHKASKEIKMYSRNKKCVNSTYPEIVKSLSKQNQKNFIIDGEIVAFDNGLTSFSTLQKRIHIKNPKTEDLKIKVYYYVFDILYVEGYDIRKIPLRERKKILRKAIGFNDEIRYTAHKNEHGEKFLKIACRDGWEGLIAKNGESEYVSKRTRDWLKFKCLNEQEFVIAGFTPPKGSRTGFGSLVLGYYDGGTLCHAGKVGTGFDENTLRLIAKKLSKIEQKKSPFEKKLERDPKQTKWVKPTLVCEIGFTEWTEAGKLRHPRFKGLRRDKKPKDVVREG